MNLKNTLLFAALCLFSAACNLDMGERGDGNVISETVEVEDFRRVLLRGGFEIMLKESAVNQVTITTDENLMDLIEVSNDGDLLEINSIERLRPSDGTKILIEYQVLEGLEVAGAAEVRAENSITGRDLEILMSGAGDINLDLDLQSLQIEVSGAGSVDLSGMVERQEVHMSGAGSYDAEDLLSHSCIISISGVGGAKVFADETLDAQVSGVGGVEYFGNPPDVRREVSGLGSIKNAGDEDRNL